VKLWVFQKKIDKHQGEISSEKSTLPKKQKQNKHWVVKKHWHKERTTKKPKGQNKKECLVKRLKLETHLHTHSYNHNLHYNQIDVNISKF
jgi:hypothetical protein